MKIAVIGDMNPTQQSVIDKMIADGHEIVYIGKDEMSSSHPFDGVTPDFYIIDEYSDIENSIWYNPSVLVGTVQHPQIKARPVKPYYRQKEKWQ